VLAVLSLTPNVGHPFFGKHMSYTCKTSEQTASCSVGCSRDYIQYEFKPNKSSNEVVIVAHFDGKIIDIERRTDCAIVDKQNWSCRTDPRETLYSTATMMNGIYQESTYSRLDGKARSHSCAKR
jgi:hypothetical protein